MRINIARFENQMSENVAGALEARGFHLTDTSPEITLHIDEHQLGDDVIVDGVNCDLERNVVNWISALLEDNKTGRHVILKRQGGIRSDRELRILVPAHHDDGFVDMCVERGIVAGVEVTLRPVKLPEHHLPTPLQPKSRWRRIFEALTMTLLICMATLLQGQTQSGGPIQPAAMPALTGDVSSTAGSTTIQVLKVNGVSYPASPSTDSVPVITAANTALYKLLIDCPDIGGNHVNYSTATHAWSCGTSGGGGGAVSSVFGRVGAVVAAINDYNFNQLAGSVAAGQMPALTGDVTSSAGTVATTLGTSGVVAGTYTKLTVDAKGRATVGATAGFADITGSVAATQMPALTGDVTSSAGATATTLPNIVAASTQTKITYNAKGQVTAGTAAAVADLSDGATVATRSGVQNQSYSYLADSGAADAYVITLSPAVGSYVAGQRFVFKASAANATTTPTLNVNGLGAKTITKNGTAALVANDIKTGQIVSVQYDGTQMQMESQLGNASAASGLGYIMQFTHSSDVSPAANTDYYVGIKYAATSRAAENQFVIDKACTVKAVQYHFFIDGTRDSAANNVTFRFDLNTGASTFGAKTMTFQLGSGKVDDTAQSQALALGDLVACNVRTPAAWSTAPTTVRLWCSLYCE